MKKSKGKDTLKESGKNPKQRKNSFKVKNNQSVDTMSKLNKVPMEHKMSREEL